MSKEFPDVRYDITKDPIKATAYITATFDDSLAKYLNMTVGARLIDEIVKETVHMWLKDNYAEIAGKISIDAVVNAAIGKIVVEALRDKSKETK